MNSLGTDLNQMANLIDAHGLTKGWFQGRDGSYCILGARNAIINPILFSEFLDEHLRSQIINRHERVTDAIVEFTGEAHIPRWNDAPERTKEEVVQMLRDCAIKNQGDEFSG